MKILTYIHSLSDLLGRKKGTLRLVISSESLFTKRRKRAELRTQKSRTTARAKERLKSSWELHVQLTSLNFQVKALRPEQI